VEFILLVPFFVVMSGLVVQFLLAGIIRFSIKDMGVKRDYSLTPTVTILISAYNEGKAIYTTLQSVSAVDYPRDKFQIHAYDDRSTDDTWEWLQKAAADFPNVVPHLNETNLGKGKTILKASKAATTEVVVTIDSDTILDNQSIREMVACFTDTKVGLVGGVVGISNPNENALTAFQTCIYYVGFYLLKIPEAYFKSVACISGCMCAIRHSVYMEIAPDIEARNWFGVPVRYSEDRFITHQTMLHGHDTVINPDARCWTPAPNTVKGYWGQQLRWQRGAMADFFRTLRHLPLNVRTIRPFALYIYFFRPLVVILLMSLIITFPLTDNMFEALTTKAIGYLIVPFFAIWIVNNFRKEQYIKQNPLKIIAYSAWGLVRSVLLTPLAVMTLDSDGWGGVRNDIEKETNHE
jgi:cellulose synthase/poly-beta-1,6-N-acetylglucosamine synthase-like glycosyltransferase